MTLNLTTLIVDVLSVNVPLKNIDFLPFLTGEMAVTAPWMVVLVMGLLMSSRLENLLHVFFLAMMIRAEFPQVSAKWAAAENSKKMRKKLCGHWSARNCDVLLFKKYLLQLYSNQPYIRTFSCCKHISNSCYSSSSSLTVQSDFRWCCCCITMEVTMTAKSLMVQPCNINCGDNDFILKSIWIELLLARKQQHHIYFKQTCIVKFIMLINHLLGKLPTRTPDT